MSFLGSLTGFGGSRRVDVLERAWPGVPLAIETKTFFKENIKRRLKERMRQLYEKVLCENQVPTTRNATLFRCRFSRVAVVSCSNRDKAHVDELI